MAGSPTALQYLDKAMGSLRQLGLLPEKKAEAAPVVALLNQIIELHPDAWPWSGHTRGDLERLLDSAGLVAQPLSGQRDPLGEHGQVVLRDC